MGHLLPPLVAFVQTTLGAYVFQQCKAGQEQLVSSLIFLLSIFVLMWKAKVFPDSINCASSVASIVLQYLISQFMMEYMMNDFWFPLEKSLFFYVPKIAELERLACLRFGLPSFHLLEFTKSRIFTVMLTYMIATMILTTVLRSSAGACLVESTRSFRKKIRKLFKRITDPNAEACGDSKRK